ncbi:gfo/Idh/MocA family oxidoreductase [Candidatus Parcubacteria bacterium]|nr:MAG: gfo/Idh/MocA family oxidoreductase [Candidatus Parcubacteria bacterium]
MSERLRCAVLGTGATGLAHLLSLQSCPHATTVAIAESDASRAKELSDRFKIPRSYTDFHEVLDQPDVEAVTIALPNHLHAEAALEALKARKDVFVEPPAALSHKEVAKLVETARRMKRTLVVGQHHRLRRDVQMAKVVIDRGDLGDIYHVRAFGFQRAGLPAEGSWQALKASAGGGALLALGQGLLDLALYLLKDFNVESCVASVGTHFGGKSAAESSKRRNSSKSANVVFDVEDFASAHLSLKRSCTIVLETGWGGFLPPNVPEQGLELLGTQGSLSLFPARLQRKGPDGYESVELQVPLAAEGEDLVHQFVEGVLHRRKPVVPLEDVLAMQQIMDALYTSARSKREVKLKMK